MDEQGREGNIYSIQMVCVCNTLQDQALFSERLTLTRMLDKIQECLDKFEFQINEQFC